MLTRIFKVLCEHKLQEEVVSDRGQRLPPAGDRAPICQPDMLSWEFCGFATSGMFLLNSNWKIVEAEEGAWWMENVAPIFQKRKKDNIWRTRGTEGHSFGLWENHGALEAIGV